jgi:hypothetical protein
MAQGIDLNHESERDCVSLAQQDEAVEDRLPFSVPRKVIVSDEEFMDALRPIEPYEMLDVIGRAEAGRMAVRSWRFAASSFVTVILVRSVMADPKKGLELHPDAWARFERAVDVVAKSPPQHRTKADKPRKKAKKKASKKRDA